MTPLRSRSNGYTLIELVAAIAASALLLGWIGEALGSLSRGYRQATAETSALETRRAAIRLFADLIRAAVPPYSNATAPRFSATADEMTFFASPSEGIVGEGSVSVRFHVEHGAQGLQSLFADVTGSAHEDSHPTKILDRQPLFENVESIGFFFTKSTAQGTRESTAWSDPAALPAQVKLVVVERSGTPPLVIEAAPRRHANSRCQFDAISLTCR